MPHISTQWQSTEKIVNNSEYRKQQTKLVKGQVITTPRGTLGGLSAISTISVPATSQISKTSPSTGTPQSVATSVFDSPFGPSPSSSFSSQTSYETEATKAIYHELEDTSGFKPRAPDYGGLDGRINIKCTHPASRGAILTVDKVLLSLEDENWALHDALDATKADLVAARADVADCEAVLKKQQSTIRKLRVDVNNCYRLHVPSTTPPSTPSKSRSAYGNSPLSVFNVSVDNGHNLKSFVARPPPFSIDRPSIQQTHAPSSSITRSVPDPTRHKTVSFSELPASPPANTARPLRVAEPLESERLTRLQPQATLLTPKTAPDITKYAVLTGQMPREKKKRSCFGCLFG